MLRPLSFLLSFFVFVTEQRIRSNADYRNALQENENNLVVIKFFAPWCRSCKAMDVKYRRLAAQNENVKFFEVRVSNPRDALAFRGCWAQRGEIPYIRTSTWYSKVVDMCRQSGSLPSVHFASDSHLICIPQTVVLKGHKYQVR